MPHYKRSHPDDTIRIDVYLGRFPIEMIRLIIPYTHGNKNLPIPAMAYYINELDIQRSGRG